MFKTLYRKIALILLILFLFVGFLGLFQIVFTTRMYIQEIHQGLNRHLSEYLATQKNYFTNGEANVDALKDTFEDLMHINPNIELYLLDPQGNILAFSAPPGRVKRDKVALGPVKKYLNEKSHFPIQGDDPRDPERKKIFSVSPVPTEGPLEGYLYIILGGEEYDSVASRIQGSYILKLSTWVAAAGLVFVFAAALFLFNLLTRRIRTIAAALDRFKKDKFSRSIELPERFMKTGGDEIDRLGKTVSQMSNRIIEQMATIKKVDMLRRELISNVSHDLRTPLSSLQGYLETLLMKNQGMSPEDQKSYLETALNQSQKLGNLISELFELAKLEAPEAKVESEPFNLGDLIHDILQKYRLPAEKSSLSLKAEFPHDLPLVYADIGMIERAIHNLIDNAFAWSKPGGSITLEVEPHTSKITVRVRDDGYGIKEEDIPHIFERFYQGKRIKSDDKDDSTGLGLAITKRILELHGSTIEVDSQPNYGTVFTFFLPLAKGKA